MYIEVLHREPQGEIHQPVPLLFLHGSYCAAWVWDEFFLPYFSSLGFDAYALSLRGHGGSDGQQTLRNTRLVDFLADVQQVADALPARPVLIGHSLGGGIVEKYMEAHPEIPAGVLVAPAPYSGIFTSAIHMLLANPRPIVHAIARRDFTVLSGSVTRAHMMTRVDPACRQTYLKRLEKEESVRALFDLELHRANPRNIHAPLLLLGGASDEMVFDWQIRKTGSVFGVSPVFFPEMGHELMLEPGWQTVADTIAGWLKDRLPA